MSNRQEKKMNGQISSRSKNNLRELKQFFKALFTAGDLIEVRAFGSSMKKVIAQRYYGFGRPLRKIVQEMEQLNRVRSGNICFGVCPRPQEGKTKKKDIRVVRALWADVDNCSVEEVRKRLERAGLPKPSIIVNSGHGVHLYWLLSAPVNAQERLQQIEQKMKSIARAIGGDSVQNLDRLLRVPGFKNMKGTQPVSCRIVEIDPNLRYSFDTFRVNAARRNGAVYQIPEMPDDTIEGGTGVELSSELEEKIATRLRHLSKLRKGDRSEKEFACLLFLSENRVEKEAAWCLVKEIGKFKERGREYFDLSWDKAAARARPGCEYFADDRGTFAKRNTKEGVVHIKLANFTARIISDIQLDDGQEMHREYGVEAAVCDSTSTFRIPAERFTEMSWIAGKLGPCAIVEPGQGKRDQLRAAIQYLSDGIQCGKIFCHIGWTDLNGQKIYLHTGGGIGAKGTLEQIEVSLPSPLGKYKLPAPPTGKALKRAIGALLGLVKSAPGPVGVSTLAAVCRSVIGSADFSLFLYGKTGNGKSELAALAQRCFGKEMDARHLPGNWSSTANANEVLAFHAKDAILSVDDFTPTGFQSDVQRQHKEADRLLRGQGNQSGRQRLRTDATQRPSKAPRGLILSTGEDLPQGESLRARIWTLEIDHGTVDWEALSRCQHAGTAGLYAEAIAGYIQWLAGRLPQIQVKLQKFREQYRADKLKAGLHHRTPSMTADLLFGLQTFFIFAQEKGALQNDKAKKRLDRYRKALEEAAFRQEEPRSQSDPVQRFWKLLRQAIATGKAHLATTGTIERSLLPSWGWRANSDSTHIPQGEMIGWLEGPKAGKVGKTEIYLLPDAAYSIAKNLAVSTNEPLGVGKNALTRRLRESGHLLTIDTNRDRNTIRKTFDGHQHDVLHLAATTISQA